MSVVKIDSRTVVLGVEQQVDFTRPHGAFHIDGVAAIPNMNRLMLSPAYVVTTVDWHPLKPIPHVSFFQWGAHCVPMKPGAAYDPDLDTTNVKVEFKKGTGVEEDIYDSFDIPRLPEFVQMLDPDRVIVIGSAIPVCPTLTAISSAKRFETYVAWDACCFIRDADLEAARKQLEDHGVIVKYTKDFTW